MRQNGALSNRPMETLMRIRTHSLVRGAVMALALTPVLSAQSQSELKAKYDEKLSHEFVEYGGWTTDYDAARKKAEEEGKVLFVYFSRSYAP